jgi:hypothetical protein
MVDSATLMRSPTKSFGVISGILPGCVASINAAIVRKKDIERTAGISLGVLYFKPSFCRMGETAHMKATRRETRKPHKGILPTFQYRLSQNQNHYHCPVSISARIFSRRAK